MADVIEDVELAELLAIIAAVGVGGYLIYKFLSSATCIGKVGVIPGVTGATQAQVCAANTANNKLQNGGYVVWSCGSDFDYFQPCGGKITEARHNGWNSIWPWGTQPVTYTCVPVACYDFTKCGICQSAAARATGN